MLRPIHHLGYVVEDLHRDVPRFAAATGAGPFFAMEHIPFPGGGVGHVAWLADSLEDEVAWLEDAGITPFHAGRTGPASAVWFDGGDLFGHPIEVLERRDEPLRFYSMVRETSAGWDGSGSLRIMTGTPA